ncbi:hypothetical protein [Muricoccus pecuniae]|uniref:Tfp pilus assembly protein PilX n=1 Tax=Muricoccus pecuniae TaxID=693023 RepID=A0A840Y2E2_9PROT|nr:hypothetical protein [Roseomonas pecuniae]MBB5694905.1 Tfp pilus assembly protein PilX [Roseomonas pecuniae]
MIAGSQALRGPGLTVTLVTLVLVALLVLAEYALDWPIPLHH